MSPQQNLIMKKILLLVYCLCSFLLIRAQDQKTYTTEKLWRINRLNPAGELEVPTGDYSVFSSALGVGYGGGYPDITFGSPGFIYIIAPFGDLQQKWFYNLNKRLVWIREKQFKTIPVTLYLQDY